MSVHFIYDPIYLKHDTGIHPENAGRLEAILHFVETDELLSKKLVRTRPRPASDEDIARCHRHELIEHIRRACEHGETHLDEDTRISAESFEVGRLATGGALVAVDAVMAAEGG